MSEYIIAFFNGFLSFTSPCIFPLIPGYLSLISGFSAKEIIDGNIVNKKRIFLFSLFFVIGFSFVFSSIGVFSSFAGSFLTKNRLILEKISGVVIIILGLHISGLLKIKFFEYEKRKIFKMLSPNYFTSFITGMSFAFGWSPCIGPFLATTLAIAANKSVFDGMTLLFTYSVGMGFPFLIVSVFGSFVLKFISARRLFLVWVERAAGLLMAFLGVLVFLGRFSLE